MDRRSSQSVGNQGTYRSSTNFQVQQPNADPSAGSVDATRRSSAAPVAASQRGSYQQSIGGRSGSVMPPTPPASLASPGLPVASTPPPVQRGSATVGARGSRQSAGTLLNDTGAPQTQRTSMLVQLQQPTPSGGSVVQPVRNI